MPFTILIIDDDPLLLTASELQESDGYRVLRASSGEDELGQVQTVRPDLIPLDYNITKMF